MAEAAIRQSQNATAASSLTHYMTIYDTLLSTPALIAGALGLGTLLYLRSAPAGQQLETLKTQAREVGAATQAGDGKAKAAQAAASMMSAPATELAAPKDDAIPVSQLAQHNGSDPTKPIYVAIKGRVFDVSAKRDMYGPGAGYSVFAGKDASKGLGMSSLDPKDAVADYSGLDAAQRKTLDQWESFFEKRYNIVGKVAP
ncbi:hypothetical protein Q5752_006175 [Cryptotrichosporon argae]